MHCVVGLRVAAGGTTNINTICRVNLFPTDSRNNVDDKDLDNSNDMY